MAGQGKRPHLVSIHSCFVSRSLVTLEAWQTHCLSRSPTPRIVYSNILKSSGCEDNMPYSLEILRKVVGGNEAVEKMVVEYDMASSKSGSIHSRSSANDTKVGPRWYVGPSHHRCDPNLWRQGCLTCLELIRTFRRSVSCAIWATDGLVGVQAGAPLSAMCKCLAIGR